MELAEKDRVNLVLLAYKMAGYSKIVADGIIGKVTVEAIQSRRRNIHPMSEDKVNLIVLAHKAAGNNDNLIADGVAGEELWKAEQVFLAS